ncbi:ferritin-like domain-containing protein, partial [Candidatus Kapabacteria bacterium]|nr:ferritin-like domain-containing protein [Candidatus Kapabacteria bacterium]
SWESPLHGFKHSLAHEQKVTESINQLADMAIKIADHATHGLLQWFIQEQVEEEASVHEIVDRLALAGDSPGGLFILDNDMRSRKLTAE